MLKLSILELFFRTLPESFLYIFAVYSLSKTVIYLRQFLMSSLLFAVLTHLIRLLPIHYGVNTILGPIVLIILTVNINKIGIIKSIKSGIILIILEFICEGINVLVIQYVFKKDVNYIFSDPFLKILYGIPSLLIFGCVIMLYYNRLKRRKELKCVSYGEVNE